MKSMFWIVFCVSLVAGVAVAMPAIDGAVVRSAKKSLLKPMAFAKTMNDMPMEYRWAIEAEGYLPYESVYDASGRCIKNCAYPGITLREEIERTQRATNQLVYDLCMDNGGTQEECATDEPGGGQDRPESGAGGSSSGGSSSGGGGSGGSGSGGSGSGGSDIAGGFGSPISVTEVPRLKVSSIPGPRRGNNNQSTFHSGVDMSVEEGTHVYAIYRGKVLFAGPGTYGGGAGCFVKIEHTINGNKYYSRYLHLKGEQEEGQEATNCEISVRENNSVEKGEKIALSGKTGRGTGAHLHYDMFVNDGNSKPMYIDVLGSAQNWAEVNQSRRDNGYTRWSYKEGGERHNLLGRTYIVRQASSNVMIDNCETDPDRYTPTSGEPGSGCGISNNNADKVCRCITKSLKGCTGVY